MRAFWQDRPWSLRVAALGLAALLVAVLAWAVPGAFAVVEEAVGDQAWRLAAGSRTERRVVIVDIDEKSIQAQGPWPWPRETLATLVDRLRAAGVAVQALDIAFPEPKPGDESLAAALHRGPTVLGQIFSLDPSAAPVVGSPSGAVGAACPIGVAQSSGLVGNAPGLVAPPVAAGHLTPSIAVDGVVRSVPALICHAGKPYVALSLAALTRAAAGDGVPSMERLSWQLHSATTGGQGFGRTLAPAQWLESPALPGMLVPLDADGSMRVPYGLRRDALLSVSAQDVLSGHMEPRLLRGAVALIGATAFGIGDTVATPLSAVASGVEVHAQLTAGVLDGRVVYTPQAAGTLELGMGLVVAALLLLLSAGRLSGARAGARAGAWAGRLLPLGGVALALGCCAVGAVAPSQWALWLPWSGAAMYALVATAALMAAEHALTRAQRERLSAHLGAYLPAPVAERLAAIDPTGHLQAERRNITVLVADIRNFSAFAVHRPAEATAAVLHAFSCVAVDVVERHGGVVESVVGDSIVAMWNAYPQKGQAERPAAMHAERAMAAARELLGATAELLAAAPSDRSEASAVQPLALGIGLECGDAIVGSFGPVRRRSHSALGEPVTVAVRLQSMTQDLSLPILVGPRMAAALPAAQTQSLGEYLLPGLSRHCELFAPVAWSEWAHPAGILPAESDGAEPSSVEAAGVAPTLVNPNPLLSSARASGDL